MPHEEDEDEGHVGPSGVSQVTLRVFMRDPQEFPEGPHAPHACYDPHHEGLMTPMMPMTLITPMTPVTAQTAMTLRNPQEPSGIAEEICRHEGPSGTE
jgi:hypothetical protein